MLQNALLWTCVLGSAAAARTESSDLASLQAEAGVPQEEKVYIVIQLTTPDGKNYTLEAPDGCANVKCRVRGYACSFRKVLGPLDGPLMGYLFYAGDGQDKKKSELKEKLLPDLQQLKIPVADDRTTDIGYIGDLSDPRKVTPEGFEHWKYYYVWTVPVPSVKDFYTLQGCRLALSEGRFPKIGKRE